MNMNQLHSEIFTCLENENITVEETLIKIKQLLDEYYDDAFGE